VRGHARRAPPLKAGASRPIPSSRTRTRRRFGVLRASTGSPSGGSRSSSVPGCCGRWTTPSRRVRSARPSRISRAGSSGAFRWAASWIAAAASGLGREPALERLRGRGTCESELCSEPGLWLRPVLDQAEIGLRSARAVHNVGTRVWGFWIRAEESGRTSRLDSEMPHYDEARLVRLLRLLRAAPVEWVRRAQRIPLRSAPLTDRDLEELGRRLEQDASFRREFDVDPVAAAKAAGMGELGARLEYEIGELIALAGRVARDANRRDELVGALGDPAAA